MGLTVQGAIIRATISYKLTLDCQKKVYCVPRTSNFLSEGSKDQRNLQVASVKAFWMRFWKVNHSYHKSSNYVLIIVLSLYFHLDFICPVLPECSSLLFLSSNCKKTYLWPLSDTKYALHKYFQVHFHKYSKPSISC